MYNFEKHCLFPFGCVLEDFLTALNHSLERIKAQIKWEIQQEAFIKWPSEEGSCEYKLIIIDSTIRWVWG